MKGKLDLLFDWKAMGINAYVPLCVVCVLIGYGNLRKEALTQVIPVLELTFPVFAAWWSIFLFQDFLEEEGSEVLFCCPIQRWKLGIARTAIFFAIYIILMLIMLLVIDQWFRADLLEPLSLQLGLQSFFFAGLGYLSMCLTRNSGWALVIIVVYNSIQILTRGALFPYINIFIFNERPLSWAQLWPLSVHTLFFGVLFWLGGQILFGRSKHFN